MTRCLLLNDNGAYLTKNTGCMKNGTPLTVECFISHEGEITDEIAFLF